MVRFHTGQYKCDRPVYEAGLFRVFVIPTPSAAEESDTMAREQGHHICVIASLTVVLYVGVTGYLFTSCLSCS